MLNLYILFISLVVSLDHPYPPERLGTSVCDSGEAIVIKMMSESSANTGSPDNCTVLTSYFTGIPTDIPWDVSCACYTDLTEATIEENWYYYNCRLTENSVYWLSESIQYCRNDLVYIGETDTIALVDVLTNTFDLSSWEGVTSQSIGQGQMLRKTFTVMTTETPDFFAFEFNLIPSGVWDEDEKVVVQVGTDPWETIYMTSVPSIEITNHKFSFANPTADARRRLAAANYTVTVGFTSDTSGSDQSFWIEPIEFGAYSRQEAAELCRGTTENVGTTYYPIFNQELTGFMSPNTGSTASSEKVTFRVEVPRYYYNFAVDFVGGSGMAGFNEDRTYTEDVSNLNQTYWSFEGNTMDGSACGYEPLIAEIPWTVLNEQSGGGLELLTEFSDGNTTHTEYDAEITSGAGEMVHWYIFGGVLQLTGNEYVYTEETEPDSGASREWTTERYQVWEVPFIIRQQRIVMVATTIDYVLPPLLINFVGALTQYVQANTVYDLSSRNYRADVVLDLTTKVLYPYILINGENVDDPPVYFEDMDAPLSTDTWFPPTIKFDATNHPGVSVNTSIEWVSEDREDCTFISDVQISVNNLRECQQYWRVYIVPLEGSCYIDGTYEIEFGARCFYEKPTCLFGYDDVNDEYVNTATLILDVESTNMCPELVMDVDISGQLCNTGRYNYMQCHEFTQEYPCGHDGSFCVGPPPPVNTYFQNDITHFFVEVDSTDAKIIYTKIIDIWTTPKSTLADPEIPADPNLYTTHLFDSGVAQDITFTDGTTGVTETVPAVILETQDSNYFAGLYASQGVGDTDYGMFAGFKVMLDERIFPAPIDRFYDVVFTVTVEVLYEGWGDEKPTRRKLTKSLPLSGSDNLMFQDPIAVSRRVINKTPCADKSNMRWALTVKDTPSRTDLIADLSSLLDSSDFSLVDLFADTDSKTAIVKSSRGDLWEALEEIVRIRPRTFQTSTLSLLSSATCLDIPEGKNPTAHEVKQCAEGNICSFYEGKTFEQYYETQESLEDTGLNEVIQEDAASQWLLSFSLLIIFAYL